MLRSATLRWTGLFRQQRTWSETWRAEQMNSQVWKSLLCQVTFGCFHFANWIYILRFVLCQTDTEKQLQDKLASISRSQLREDRNMEALLTTVDGIRNNDQQYRTEVSEIRKLISDVRLKLQQAKRDIQEIVSISGLCFWTDYSFFAIEWNLVTFI